MSSSEINSQQNQLPSLQELLQIYIDNLNKYEKKAIEIAKNHLGSSFDLKRSIGFIRWKDTYLKSLALPK